MLADGNSGVADADEQKMDSDPLELNKDPELIKETQKEIGTIDVLVCGKCCEVFHFIEGLQEHKLKCDGVSKLCDSYKNDVKPPMWAFLLWKNCKRKEKEDKEADSTWSWYQNWCQLTSTEKQRWISAADSILTFTRVETGKLLEANKAHQEASVVRRKYNKISDSENRGSNSTLEPGEVRPTKRTTIAGGNFAEKKAVLKAKQLLSADAPVSTAVPKKINENRKALRTCKNDIIVVGAIDKILDRRFNQQKQCLEYLIKWDSPTDTANTWEPKNHLERCAILLEEFDKSYIKKKMGEKKVEPPTVSLNDSGRPQRSSKQKALNQVKAWCGDITEDESGKRKYMTDEDDGESTDSFEKKIKMEDDTDTSEDEKPMVTIRKISKQGTNSSFNGVSSKKTESINVSSSQRVIRVNQKQLPSLSSGVYLMSKNDGIIKIDSNNPAAASSSSPLLKVGGKIGQTHIKMIKKDVESTGGKLQKVAGGKSAAGEGTKGQARGQYVMGKKGQIQNVPKGVKVLEIAEQETFKSSPVDDDSDDGIEEMEFPTDLPLPRPDSPPGEFTLCPLTGRILGENGEVQEPEEPPPIIKTEPNAEPLPEPISLENIVKIAVMDTSMDISPENNDVGTVSTVSVPKEVPVSTVASLPVETPSVTTSIMTSTKAVVTTVTGNSTTVPKISIISTTVDLEKSITPTAIAKSVARPSLVPASGKASVTSQSSNTSILNKVLTNPRPSQITTRIIEHHPKKTLQNTPSTMRQQKVVYQQHLHKPLLHKPSPNTSIIYKVSPNNRNRQTVMPRSLSQQHEPVLKRSTNVTTYKPANIARKIGSTTIYKTEKPKPSAIISTPQVINTPASLPPTVVTTTNPPPLVRQSSSTVISMPLLTDDEVQPQAISQQQSQQAVSSSLTTDINTISAAVENPTATIIESQQTTQALPIVEIPTVVENVGELAVATGASELSTYSIPDTDTPILITSEDGTIYQVAGQNEEGQTILISEGPDGTQQCVIVSSDSLAEEIPAAIAAAASAETQGVAESEQATMEQTHFLNLAEPTPEAEGEAIEGEDTQVVAQIIKADPPSPGGTRKVVLMLPDGNLMMTNVSAEQYAALELDK